MAYQINLSGQQQLYLENRARQTIVILGSMLPHQQQSQSNSFATGQWLESPTLFRTAAGWVLRVEAEQGQVFIQLQNGGMQRLEGKPVLADAEVLPLQQVANRETFSAQSSQSGEGMQPMQPMEPMKPMKPMQPMTMGNMQMNPMRMEMGDMVMQMGTPEAQSPAPGKRFCSQCGASVKESDRFCASCGHRLDS